LARSTVAGAKTSGQFQSIPLVRLDPIACLLPDQRRSDHLTFDTELDELPVQRENRRAGFVANPDVLLSQLLHQATNSARVVGDDSKRPHLAAAWLGYGYGNCFCMYVESDESGSFTHDRSPSHVALRHGLGD
jgi:hypothetical protein